MKNEHKRRKLLILLGWLVIWQLVSIAVGNRILLVGPVETMLAIGKQMVQLVFWKTVMLSLARIAIGFFAGLCLGVLLAIASVYIPVVEEIVTPLLQVIKAIPVASFVVLFLIWWHAQTLSIMISFMVVLPNIYLNTIEGIRHTDHALLEMARVFGMSRWNQFFYLYRPACKPFLDSAMKISIGMSWKSGVAAEVIGTPDFSIGEALYMAKIYLETADVLAWTVVTVILSVICENFIILLWNHFCYWQPACKIGRKESKAYPKTQTAVAFTQVSMYFGEKVILNRFSKEYNYKETYEFRTPSGSGKTTQFRLITGLEHAQMGQIKTAETRFGYLFQEDRLCEQYTPVKNVELVNADAVAARELLAELLPQEDLDKPCSALSGGMKRRVALARAFASKSHIILLDEPFTGMDLQTMELAKAFIDKYSSGKCVFLASHIEKELSFSKSL